MSTYVIGDIHGCYNELRYLIKKISFNYDTDKLIFVGDLVNRGPQSLEVLRFIKSLGRNAEVVLGNHDLYLIALAYGYLLPNKNDTLNTILDAKDKFELISWLRQQHLLYQHEDYIITHAGVPPNWSVNQAQSLAKEVERNLKNDIQCKLLLSNLIGSEPKLWDNNLRGIARWRCITNYFTRMRICTNEGILELSFKGETKNIPEGFLAWFDVRNPKIPPKYRFIFGHWASLRGMTNNPRYIAIDTGCVWKKKLSSYCIEKEKIYQIPSK